MPIFLKWSSRYCVNSLAYLVVCIKTHTRFKAFREEIEGILKISFFESAPYLAQHVFGSKVCLFSKFVSSKFVSSTVSLQMKWEAEARPMNLDHLDMEEDSDLLPSSFGGF